MAVDLNETKVVIPEITRYNTDTITVKVPEGVTLRIETSPDGAEIASGVVPDGKVWDVKITVAIAESDA